MISCPSCGELVLLDDPDEAGPISKGARDPELDPPVQFQNNDDDSPAPPENFQPLEMSPEGAEYSIANGDIEFEVEEPGQRSDENAEAEEPIVGWQPQDPNKPGLEEIANYGNSEISQARDGLLMFDVVIDGIDTNELRAAVKDVLGDKRFLWNAESLMSSVKNGKLRVAKVNSIKASLLVKRLKNLDVKIRWEQYAITQMDLD
jgi:hypothetical protein